MQFCSRCHRRTSGVACSCSESNVAGTAVTRVRPRTSDVAQRAAARRSNRTVALVGVSVAAVVGLVIAVSVSANPGRGSSSSGYNAASAGSAGRAGSGSGGYQPTYQTYAGSPTTETSVAPTFSGDALEQLRQYANADLSSVRATLEDHWVAQLSSKKVGMPADGIVYDAPAILQDHLTLRNRYASVRLIWTQDWRSFKYPDFWVTVQDQAFATADDANAWCDGQGLPKDDCYAKRLRSTGGYEGNTKVR